MTQSTALDRLFPESMRYHKGHVADPKRKGGAGLTRLTPRQKLSGIVRRAPEVMLKIGRANIRCLKTHEGRSRLHQPKLQDRD
mgnify:CR=1 FL=1